MINPTTRTLIEQMRLNDFEIDHRKELITLKQEDINILLTCRPIIEESVNDIVSRFYQHQVSIPEIAVIIGDSHTLEQLKESMRQYILALFNGVYDLGYVNHRCRIGLMHKRIGVEPKLYLSSVLFLKELLREAIDQHFDNHTKRTEAHEARVALDKLLMFDVTLFFETYIRSLVADVETAKAKSDQYALSLEEKIRFKTQQVERLEKLDPLTGLLNTRDLNDILTKALRVAQSRTEPVTVVYLDINDFKLVNESQGHQRGDEILQTIGQAISGCARSEDYCFRYGGDEFFVILTNCTEQQACDIYLTALEKKIQKLEISLSVGVAQTGPDEFIDKILLIKQADENMYLFKKAHKSRKSTKSNTEQKPT